MFRINLNTPLLVLISNIKQLLTLMQILSDFKISFENETALN